MNIYSTAKVSTSFPVGMTPDKAKEYIEAAWKDHCRYGTSADGSDVEIYQQIRIAFGLP